MTSTPGPGPGPGPADAAGAARLRRAEQIARAVLGCPGVAAMSAGRFGEAVTLGPGRRVPGVRLGRPTDLAGPADAADAADPVQVNVVARYGVPLDLVVDGVRAAVQRLDQTVAVAHGRFDPTAIAAPPIPTAGRVRPVDVQVDDVDDEDEPYAHGVTGRPGAPGRRDHR